MTTELEKITEKTINNCRNFDGSFIPVSEVRRMLQELSHETLKSLKEKVDKLEKFDVSETGESIDIQDAILKKDINKVFKEMEK